MSIKYIDSNSMSLYFLDYQQGMCTAYYYADNNSVELFTIKGKASFFKIWKHYIYLGLDVNQGRYSSQIYRYNINTKVMKKLTETTNNYNEYLVKLYENHIYYTSNKHLKKNNSIFYYDTSDNKYLSPL